MRKFINLVENSIVPEPLDEAPISDISHIGDFTKASSFKHEQDRKLVTNPKAVAKIKLLWKYPEEVDYNLILVNHPDGSKHTEVGLIGKSTEASSQWVTTNMSRIADQIIPLLKDDEVNIIYTNNKGSARVPLTGWVMAHRFGHAVFRFPNTSYYFKEAMTTMDRYIGDLANDYNLRPDPYTGSYATYRALESTNSLPLLHAICTFKSARDRKLRNSFEAVHECFAQYIIRGKVIFNDIPRSVKWKNKTYSYRGDEGDYEHDNRSIKEDLAYELREFFEATVEYSVGHTFVM